MDRALVEQAQLGDRAAFSAIATGVIDRLYAIARLVLHDTDRAEDAVQEALIRCWRDLPTLRDPDRFEAWMRRLLMNAINDEFRRRRRFDARVTVLSVEPSGTAPDAETADRDELERGFRRLSGDHRTILVLHHYVGLPVPEVADALGIPLGTAKSRLHYALEALRAALQADRRPAETREVTA
jgi:RNA polymerase sigma-70 factor (ECF subfamily)